MNLGTVTSKGQTTIPQEIREKMNLKPGDKVYWRMEGGQAVMRPKNKSFEDLAGMLHRPGMKAATIEEMNEGIVRGAVRSALGK